MLSEHFTWTLQDVTEPGLPGEEKDIPGSGSSMKGRLS